MFILGQDVDVMEKYLIVHILNRHKWKTSTETIYRKDECALFPLEDLSMWKAKCQRFSISYTGY